MSNNLLSTLTSALGNGIVPTELQGLMQGEFDVSATDIDVSGAQGLTGPLDNLNLDNLSANVGSVSQSGASSLSALPVIGDMLGPINNVISFSEQLESVDIAGLMTRLQETTQNANSQNSLGLAGIEGPIREVLDINTGSPLAGAINLGNSLLPINLEGGAGNLLGRMDGITNGIRVVGAMMSIHGQFSAVQELAANQEKLFIKHEINSQMAAMLAWKTNTDLALAISNAAANDTVVINQIGSRIQEFVGNMQTVRWNLQRGLGYGDAILTQAGIENISQAIETLSTILRQTSLDSTGSLADSIKNWLSEKLPADFGTPAESLNSLIADLQAMANELAGQVNNLQVDNFIAPVTNAVGQVNNVLSDLNDAIATATGAIRSVFEQVKNLIASLNLAQIAETIETTLKPIVEVIERLEAFIAGISDKIKEVMGLAVAAVKRIKEGIVSGAALLAEPLKAVEDILAALNMEALVQGLQTGIGAIVDLLQKVDLDPYFDTAVDAMDTVSSVLEAVPLSLLPDDMEADLQTAVQPIKAIEFDRDVREVLISKLEATLAKLDGEILGEIDRMAKEVIDFLQNNDPAEKLEELEKEYFDPMLETILAVNPEEILKPVTDVLTEVKNKIAEIDLRALIIDEIDGVFDNIISYYDQCDPEPLLAPIVDKVDAFRNRIIELTGIDSWADHIDNLHGQVNAGLDKLDFVKLINELDRIYNSMLRTLGNDAAGSSVIGGLIEGLLSGSMTLRSSSYQEVISWISGGQDGAARVKKLIDQSLNDLRASLAFVDTLDPGGLSAAVMPCYRAVKQALEALDINHPLRVRFLPIIEQNAPTEIFATITANLPTYRNKLDVSIRSLDQLSSSGFSQISNASQNLRQALLPISDVKWQFIVLIRRFGVDPVGKPLMEIVGEILAALRPGRALEPFTVVVDAVKAKINELVSALVTPIKEAISQIRTLLDTIDIKIISDELKAIHTQIRDELMAFRPSVLLAAPLDAFDNLQDTIKDFDPFAPVREAVDEFKTEVSELLGPESPLRPSVMFAGLLEQYQRILALASQLEVSKALEPILTELEIITAQLDEGLSETGTSFKKLQEALP